MYSSVPNECTGITGIISTARLFQEQLDGCFYWSKSWKKRYREVLSLMVMETLSPTYYTSVRDVLNCGWQSYKNEINNSVIIRMRFF